MSKTNKGPLTNLARLFREACRWRAGADFLVDAEERFTGNEAEMATRGGAAALRMEGVRHGDLVGFLARSSARHGWCGSRCSGSVRCRSTFTCSSPTSGSANSSAGST